jgi:hypothetical protein
MTLALLSDALWALLGVLALGYGLTGAVLGGLLGVYPPYCGFALLVSLLVGGVILVLDSSTPLDLDESLPFLRRA